MCPKRSTSKWGILKCRRGDFQSETPLDKLCEQFERVRVSDYENTQVETGTSATSTYHFATAQRDELVHSSGGFELFEEQTRPNGQPLQMPRNENGISGKSFLSASDTMGTDETGGLDANMQESEVHCISTMRLLLRTELSIAYNTFSSPRHPILAAFNPLKECILAIFWELLKCSFSKSILAESDEYKSFARLLSQAAVYQTKFKDVRIYFRITNTTPASPFLYKKISLSLASKSTRNTHSRSTRIFLTRS